ncbi:hypothetical protein [Mycolicibacterium gilvum]|uniref:Uncharacterized protein n=1 Tax=Mycolicibacterium gilvum (strain DSM 45189 / LMG 24558 / Spyr1) TaxID=278137 RepID=E6TE09_MYCSR|nr:hypothetical protein [Mycolicibacterium gilvum]ADT99853.1 hypothetical protein Mspyr1_32420 [Mycolicibacterium gilvum Spyr1]
MANPAELLHQRLTDWQGSRTRVSLNEQRIAIRHLDAIEELLTEMDAAKRPTDLFRMSFDRWATLTIYHPHGWQKQEAQKHIDVTALAHLKHLADTLHGVAPALKPDGLEALRAMAQSAKELVEQDPALDPLLRQHVLQVIAHVNYCIDDYAAVGDFDLREAAERLMSTMMRTAATVKDTEGVSKWRQWMDGFWYPFTVEVTAAIPSAALTQLALGGGL